MASVVIVERDRGWERIRRDLAAMNDMAVAVGIVGSGDTREDGTSNATIYATHEFGSPENGIPERSSLRATIDGKASEYAALGRHLCGMVTDNKLSPRQAHALLGERVKADIKRLIQRGISPALKDATVLRKKSSKPLIDTAQMINAIDYEVRSA